MQIRLLIWIKLYYQKPDLNMLIGKFHFKLNIVLFLLTIFFIIDKMMLLPVSAAVFKVKEFVIEGNKGIVLTFLPPFKLSPAASRPGQTVNVWAKTEGAIAVINGGYFNHSDGFPVSHVIVNGEKKTEPEKNQALVNNNVLKAILPGIFNERAEIRVITNGSVYSQEIVPHNAPIKEGFKLVHSLQAGPQLLPVLNLEKEGFIIKDKKGKIIRDGIGSYLPAARSAIGLTKKGELLFVAVSSSGKKHGITISQLATLMKGLNCISAMALDGGSSTSLTWKLGYKWKTFVGSGKTPVRVNSVLSVLP
jgi:uncharacterized protein YigE (DUF2233 family)